MKNIEYLKKTLKKHKIIRLITIILFIISIIVVAISAPKSTVTATIFTFIAIPSVIIGLVEDRKIRKLKQQIYDVGVMSQAIEDTKEDSKN